MTDKEKAKAYDEALKIAKNEINVKGIGDTVDLCKQLFPELHESEDEKVREWLVDYFKTIGESKSWIHRGIGPKQILAYLEKQKSKDNEDFFKEGIGHYFFDGEKTHFCGSSAMETNEDWVSKELGKNTQNK